MGEGAVSDKSMSLGGVRFYRSVFFAAVALACARTEAINLVQGIDVSHWQGTINWSSVAADSTGYKFVFMKATEDTNYTDPTFNTNLAGAMAAGLMAGPYHFCRLDTNSTDPVADGASEATYFLSKIKSKYQTGQYLPPVADVEAFPAGLTTAQYKTLTSAWVDSFSDTVFNAIGVRPLVYNSKSKVNSYYTSAVAAEEPLWVAWWKGTGITSPPTNSDVTPWSTWKFWQWSDGADSVAKGDPVSGISGNVDRDVFNGTLTQLQALLVGKDASAKPGDFNRDGVANSADYNYWVANNGQTVPIYTGADANGDARVTTADLMVWVAAVPEPRSCILFLAGLVFAVFGTRRGRPAW
jgi:GH25 family lysozyme M1 (1,4-beta-N-acetylmuramidase)